MIGRRALMVGACAAATTLTQKNTKCHHSEHKNSGKFFCRSPPHNGLMTYECISITNDAPCVMSCTNSIRFFLCTS